MQTQNVHSKNRTEVTAVRFTKLEMERLRKAAFDARVPPATLLHSLFVERYPDHKDSEAPLNNCK